jgi:UDP-N-acetylbacillosamine N-acetyltransferase
LLIHGAGGHGLVVAEAAIAAGWSIVGFVDEFVPRGTKVGGREVLAADAIDGAKVWHHIAVGDNATRQRLMEAELEAGHCHATIVHPTAVISPSAAIADGVYIGPMAVVNAEAQIGRGAIINTAVVVEHHCVIEAFAHLAPRVALAGRVTVGERALIGVGACVQPGLLIGAAAIVGGGAVVSRPIPPNTTAVGVPARVVKDEET